MKKRFGLLLLAFTLLLSLLTACKNGSSDDSDKPADEPADAIYSSSRGATIVYDAGGITEENLSLLISHISQKTGSSVSTKDSSAEQSDGEIILGKTSRAISEKAYKYLQRIDLENDTEVRYVIYSDGKSVAIAYDEALFGYEYAQSEAISCFINQYCTDSSLKMQAGVYKREHFCVIKKQSEYDDAVLSAAWNDAYEDLEEIYGASFAEETVEKALCHIYR